MQEPNVPAALRLVSVPGLSFEEGSTSYFLGKESIIPSRRKPGMALWREKLFAFLSRNAFSALPAFCLPAEQTVELRGQVEI
jgi:KUP system potassium uptake protein